MFCLVERDIINRYRNSLIGVGWTLLTPLGIVGIIGAVYSIVFGTPIEEFIPMLFSGIIPWTFISSCADGGTNAYISAEGFITQTQTPIDVFPLRVAVTSAVNFYFSTLAFYLLYILLNPLKFGPQMLFIIPGFIIVFIFGVGISNLTSFVNLYIRDFAPLQSLILQALFYITPIIYPIELMKQRGFDFVYQYNPMYYMIEIVRQPMLGNYVPSWLICLIASGISLSTILESIFIINKIGRKIVFKF